MISQQHKTFSCQFQRLVESGTTIETNFISDETNEIISQGVLEYSMIVEDGDANGFTTVQINADHEIDQIFPRFVKKIEIFFI